MWIQFVNRLTPPKGIGVAFVYDLPSDEGGWGGGRIAAVAGHESERSNLMFGERNSRVATADLLNTDQIPTARKRAETLGKKVSSS